MPKLTPSRLDGVYGMRKCTADDIHDKADAAVQQIADPINTDDPKWLWRSAKKLNWLARKERAREHKARQRKGIYPGDAATLSRGRVHISS
jgi:hypothetical protein